MENNKQTKWIDRGFFAVLLIVVSAITLQLFHWQTLGSPEQYHSDMKAYILEMQGLDSGYSFPYPIFFKLAALIHLFAEPEFSVALATMLLNSLGIVCVWIWLRKETLSYLDKAFPKFPWIGGALISLASVALFFVSMLFPPSGIYLPGIKYNYLGVFTSNPFHNATYMAARPFAILAFFQFAKLLGIYEGVNGAKTVAAKKVDSQEMESASDAVARKDYILFALFLLLATMTKPSFTIVLVGAAGLIMLYRLVRAGFRNLKATLKLGLCFIPTFLDLLYQYQGVFVPDEGVEGGMGFCFGEIWGLYCDNIPLAIVLAIGFPIFVLLFHFRDFKENTLYRFSWQIYAMGFTMAFLLYEKGFRKPDFNFSWGYMYGIFFAFVGALVILLRDTGVILQYRNKTAKRVVKQQTILVILQWLAFLAHLLCGLYYFWKIFNGNMYY
ncbi:MAG: hypothetical protein II994_00340 [Lachnospiraceae bacterium]|nr:hypothetical protein [Lachnospiraceae bacterium]